MEEHSPNSFNGNGHNGHVKSTRLYDVGPVLGKNKNTSLLIKNYFIPRVFYYEHFGKYHQDTHKEGLDMLLLIYSVYNIEHCSGIT